MWKQKYTEWLEESGRRPRTVQAYIQDLAVYEKWYHRATGEIFAPEKLTNWDVKQFRAYSLDDQHVAAATWNRRRASLAQLADFAREIDAVKVDVLRGVKRQEETTTERWLDEREFGRLMRELEKNVNLAHTDLQRRTAVRDRAVAMVMLYCGLRVAEVCALTLRSDHSDLVLGERSGRLIVRDGKGGKERKIPLSIEVREALKAWLALRGSQPGPLFTGRYGEGIKPRATQERMAELGEAARIEGGLSPHNLRHTLCKRLADRGVRLEAIAAIAGHKSIRTTMRYVKPGWSDLQESVAKL